MLPEVVDLCSVLSSHSLSANLPVELSLNAGLIMALLCLQIFQWFPYHICDTAHLSRSYPSPVPVSPPAFSSRTCAPLRTTHKAPIHKTRFFQVPLSLCAVLCPGNCSALLYQSSFTHPFRLKCSLNVAQALTKAPFLRLSLSLIACILRILCTSHHNNTSQCAVFICRGTFGLRAWVSHSD